MTKAANKPKLSAVPAAGAAPLPDAEEGVPVTEVLLTEEGEAPEEETESPESELDILFPTNGEVTLTDGEEIHIKPYTFGQLPKALVYLTSLVDVMEGTDLDMLRAIASHGEEVIKLIMLATGKERTYFDSMPSDDGLKLAIATFEVNKDFFVRKLQPLLSRFLPSTNSENPQSNVAELPVNAKAVKAAG